MKHREVTITLRLTVPDSPDLDERINSLDEPPVTMLADLLHSVAGVLLEETVCVIAEELGDGVEAIDHRHTVGAPFEESEDW